MHIKGCNGGGDEKPLTGSKHMSGKLAFSYIRYI
jgi:hypothetical protein